MFKINDIVNYPLPKGIGVLRLLIINIYYAIFRNTLVIRNIIFLPTLQRQSASEVNLCKYTHLKTVDLNSVFGLRNF